MGIVDEIIDWASLGGVSGDVVDTPQNIRDYLDREFENIATIVDSDQELDNTFNSRAPVFSNPYDVASYLARGGLLLDDGQGGVVPNPMVALKRIPIWSDEEEEVDYEYQVYIGSS